MARSRRRPPAPPSPIPAGLASLAFPIADLVDDPQNARAHSERNLAAVEASLREFGWRGVVVAHEDTKQILAGHARVAAARKLGWTEAPVLFVDDVRARAIAYAVADNRTGELAAWDWENLSKVLADLQDTGLREVLGFDDAELSRMLDAGVVVTDPAGEWRGMPGFTQPDKTAFRSLVVHFRDQAAVDAFAALLKQPLTDKTRFLWYPEIVIEPYADKRWAGAADAP